MTLEVRYAPGDRFLAVGPTVIVLASDRALVERMWPVVRDGGDTAAVLAGALGAGFGGLADLLVVEALPGRTEVLLRGDIDIVAITADGSDLRADGRGVRTWREFSADGVNTLTAGAATVDLPLRCGIARAAGFRWTVDTEDPIAESGPAATTAVMSAPAVPSATPSAADIPTSAPYPVSDVPGVAPAETMAQSRPADGHQPNTAAVQPVRQAESHSRARSMRGMDPTSPTAPPAAYGPTTGDTKLGAGDEFGHLFESTVLRSPEDAAVRIDPDDEEGPATDAAPSQRLGDHDGSTILGGQLAALLRASRAAAPPPFPPPPPPPPISPRLELVFSSGQIVPIDQPVVVGRKPQVDRVSGAEIPRLVTVSGPNNDISRSHLEIRSDGVSVLATDLGSTNGTTVADRSGTRQLRAHTAERITVGSRLDLGDGITIDVRDAR